MSRLRTLRTALLVADVVAHVVAFGQARRDDAPPRDTFGMLSGAAMYSVLAVGVATGNSVAEREATRAPLGGVAALLGTWRRSRVPAATRYAIIGIDVALVVSGMMARREESDTTVEIA